MNNGKTADKIIFLPAIFLSSTRVQRLAESQRVPIGGSALRLDPPYFSPLAATRFTSAPATKVRRPK
jgi:hypothetical protein